LVSVYRGPWIPDWLIDIYWGEASNYRAGLTSTDPRHMTEIKIISHSNVFEAWHHPD